MIRKLFVVAPLAAIVMVQLVRIEFVMADELKVKPAKPTPTTISYVQLTPPEYVIEPPDVLTINAVRLVPKAPYRIEPFDALLVRVRGTLPDQPIADAYAVDVEGKIDLGPTYGRIEVAGLTVDEANEVIKRSLEGVLQSPEVSVSLASSAAPQQIVGEHLVAPDGRVNLGVYGTVYVAGHTIGEATKVIEKQLSKYLSDPRVAVDVFAYNSKKFYVITRNSGKGDNIVTAPITGNETVLDALALVDESFKQSSTKIWISRPSDQGDGSREILLVRWDEISTGSSTSTNYQLLPGDRLFIESAVAPIRSGDIPAPSPASRARPRSYYDAIGPQLEAIAAAKSATTVQFTVGVRNDRASGSAKYVTEKLASNLGETAKMEIQGGTLKGLRLELTAKKSGPELILKIRLTRAAHENIARNMDFEVTVNPGGTVLVPIAEPRPETDTSHESNFRYIAITPSLVTPDLESSAK